MCQVRICAIICYEAYEESKHGELQTLICVDSRCSEYAMQKYTFLEKEDVPTTNPCTKRRHAKKPSNKHPTKTP